MKSFHIALCTSQVFGSQPKHARMSEMAAKPDKKGEKPKWVGKRGDWLCREKGCNWWNMPATMVCANPHKRGGCSGVKARNSLIS